MGIRTLGHIPRPHDRNTVPYRIQFKTNHWLYTPNMESKAGFSLQKHWWWLHGPYPFRPGQQSQYPEGNALLPTLHLPFCSERKPCCGQRFQDWLLSLRDQKQTLISIQLLHFFNASWRFHLHFLEVYHHCDPTSTSFMWPSPGR